MTHKFALLSAAIALSSATNAFASTLDASTAAVPQSHAIAPSIDPSPDPPSAKFSSATANTQYWACFAVSRGTGQAGWAQGGSESSALSKAKSECGRSDCTNWRCQELGCVALEYGKGQVVLASASGYGSKDASEAESKAVSTCKAHASGCGKPGYICSRYID